MGMKKHLSNNICLLIALLHFAITFVTDRNIFTFPDKGTPYFNTALADYIICKIITLAVLYIFYNGINSAFIKKDRNLSLREVIKTALPYLIIIIPVTIIKLRGGYLTNDENAIYANAISLTHDTWFNYLTTYYYIVALMIIPFKYAPIILKLFIQLMTCGYVVYRIKKYYGNKLGMFGYLLFVMYPIIAYTTSAHRLPIYFLIYLVLFTKLLFDKLENHELSVKEAFGILLTCAVLTQWRTEGIYLAVLIPILVIMTYTNIRTKKNICSFVLASLILQYIISIPQTGFTASNLDGAANDRMKPFYAYTITNMYRNGLDLEKNAKDLAIVDRYLAIDKIEAINEYYGDINYEDVLILYKDDFIGVRENATVEDFINYSDALKRIFKNNPGVFMKTRWGAFCYAALPYHITYNGAGLRNLISFGISIVKSLAYNLFIPIILIFVLLIYSLSLGRWYSFFTFGGLMAHWFIVFVLAPASYFKYYFPVYIMGYFYLLLLALHGKNRISKSGKASPIV